MEAALEELNIQEKRNIQAIATKYSVERSVLSKQFHKKTGTKAQGYNS